MQGNGLASRPAVAQTKSAPKKTRMSLANVQEGILTEPDGFFVHGIGGVGKSTLGSKAPKPIFLGVETKGSKRLAVKRMPQPQTWQDVLDAMEALLTEDHDYETLVVDTVDSIEPLLFVHALKVTGSRSGDVSYNEYRVSVDQWRIFLARCDELKERRGMTIMLLAHTVVKEFRDPMTAPYERYVPKLYKESAALMINWADAVLFANHDVTTTENKRGRVRAHSTSARFIYTQQTAAYDAKNRMNLPDRLPLDWHELTKAIEANAPDKLASLRRQLEAIGTKLASDVQQALVGAIARVGEDTTKLAHLLDWARAKAAIAEDDDTTTTTEENKEEN